MARQLRIEYPGAFYHVYSRGNQKQPIFLSDDDRRCFLETLGEAHERLDAVVHLYCLMRNHYHLGLETPKGNLSKIMHFINTAFSIYLNKKHGRCGHLFQGRFKAILVEVESYARTITVYIHGNPVRDAIVSRPEEYAWSSARIYYGLSDPPSWLSTNLVMECFGRSVDLLRKEHTRLLRLSGRSPEDSPLSQASQIGIMGSPTFIERIRRSFLIDKVRSPDPEISELRRLKEKPSLAHIQSEVIAALGVDNRFVKKATIYLAHKNSELRLSEIAGFFGIGPAAAGVAYRKMKAELCANEPLRGAVGAVEARLFGIDVPKRGEIS